MSLITANHYGDDHTLENELSVTKYGRARHDTSKRPVLFDFKSTS